ncbi:hypothetical protein ACFV1N_17715 [Streptosporangium canum]|uniref:hypothetical protein n=1 Tax=Streptosporangium canum TaxID=324952 RepID=UPI003685D1CD
MTKILTTQNAQITTAAVEVKTLTISGKQVTLSVFRQLREEPLLTEDVTLNGVPWGYVNYHPDKCGNHRRHLHVVWQRGADLLRSTVYAPEVAKFQSVWAKLFIEAAIAEGLTKRSAESFGISKIQIWPHWATHPHLAEFSYGGVSFQAVIREDFADAYDNNYVSPYVKEKAMAITGPHGDAGSIAALKLPVAEYLAVWDALTALPHLFIAV